MYDVYLSKNDVCVFIVLRAQVRIAMHFNNKLHSNTGIFVVEKAGYFPIRLYWTFHIWTLFILESESALAPSCLFGNLLLWPRPLQATRQCDSRKIFNRLVTRKKQQTGYSVRLRITKCTDVHIIIKYGTLAFYFPVI